MTPRPSGWLVRAVATALVVAGLAHLTTILVISRKGTDAFQRVAALGNGAMLQTFAPAGADRTFPGADPAMATAFCLFDLDKGPVDVRLPVTPLDIAVLAVHGPDGAVVYALTNSAAVGGAISLVLTPQQTAAPPPGEDGEASVPKVPLQASQGFVMASALASLPGLRPAAEAMARGLVCRPLR